VRPIVRSVRLLALLRWRGFLSGLRLCPVECATVGQRFYALPVFPSC